MRPLVSKYLFGNLYTYTSNSVLLCLFHILQIKELYLFFTLHFAIIFIRCHKFKISKIGDKGLIKTFILHILVKINRFWLQNICKLRFTQTLIFLRKPGKHDFTPKSFMSDLPELAILYNFGRYRGKHGCVWRGGGGPNGLSIGRGLIVLATSLSSAPAIVAQIIENKQRKIL